MEAARRAGISDDEISLIARPDIEMETIPEGRREGETDFKPAILRGAGAGGAIGLVAGLVAVAVPAIGVSVAGAAVMTAVGAAVGSWTAALFGSTVPDPVKRQFEDEIEAGRILVVIDGDPARMDVVEAAVIASGAEQLPYHAPTMVS